MRLSFALLLLGLSVTSSGCALVEDAHRNVCVAIKTPIENHREMKRNRQWAECAWMGIRAPNGCAGYSCDYASGFKEGYAEYLFRGGDGEPPVMAPLHYRHLRYQTPEGYQSIQDWFHGYRHGAMVARESGAREWIVGPTGLHGGAETVAHHVPPLAPVVAPGIVPHMAPKMMPKVVPEERFEVLPLPLPRVVPSIDMPPKPQSRVVPASDVRPLPQPRVVPATEEPPSTAPIKIGFNVGLSEPPPPKPATPKYIPPPTPQARFGMPRGDEPVPEPQSTAPNWTSPPLRARFKMPDVEASLTPSEMRPQAPSLDAAKLRLRPAIAPSPVVTSEYVEPKKALPEFIPISAVISERVQPKLETKPLAEFNPLPEFSPLPAAIPERVPLKPVPVTKALPEFDPLPEFKPLPATVPEREYVNVLPESKTLPEFRPLPSAPKTLVAPPIAPTVLPAPTPPLRSELEIIQRGVKLQEPSTPPSSTSVTNSAGHPAIIQSAPNSPGERATRPIETKAYEPPQVLIWGGPIERVDTPRIPLGAPELRRPLER